MARFFYALLVAVAQHERMPPHLPDILLLTILCALLGSGTAQWRRRRQAEAEAGRLSEALEQRRRALDLFAGELHGRAMALLGRAAAARDAPLEGHARALLALAADAQDCAAAAAGPRALREESLALAALLQEAVEHVTLALSPGRRHWQFAPELYGVMLRGDRRALRAAVMQVLTRAVRHSRDGDPVALRLLRTEETVAIVVEDEGAGLAAEDLGPRAREGGTRGLGLGLALARQLVQAHGGELRLEAVHRIGARAWIVLPRDRLLSEGEAVGAGPAGVSPPAG